MDQNYYKIKYHISGIYKEILILCKNGDNIIKTFYDSINISKASYSKGTDVIITSIILLTCDGCINDVSNQLGHMDKGGCMYISQNSD